MTVVTASSEAIDLDADADDTAATRHARALAALRSAEVRTGVRKQATATRAIQAVRPQPFADRPADRPADGDTRVLPVDQRLASLLPDGGLRTGTTVVVQGSTSLLLTLLAEASRDGAWTVLVGYPAAGMAAAADAGCDLTRTLVVPLPAGSGVDASAVLAALIDGMDVVVIGPEVALLEQDRRRLAARARERGTVLVAALPTPASSTRREAGGVGWAGAHVVLEATEGDWTGVDHGAGWLRRRTLRVRRTGRGNASRPLHLDVEVPVCRAAGGGTGGGGAAGVVEPAGGRGPVTGSQGEGSESRPQLELVG
ncbi:hypothetical protein APR04_004981 [Promicromonospora umidemergens]|uniref:Protein RecA n=1 Tax=Promicromonospora umidemergens TaxID=629679 RepID=A0ABP8XV14_9MICO|nr:hypothetical protein [Promicromonospora umidemergens]MCP2286045.1 hypothetical protein [Promicromonospora umidemergens]